MRVNLAALPEDQLEQLGQTFIRSAAAHNGTLTRFLEKLDVLCQLAKVGTFHFDIDVLDAYLTEYKAAEYPPVSHSVVYREAYHPAYRIIQK